MLLVSPVYRAFLWALMLLTIGFSSYLTVLVFGRRKRSLMLGLTVTYAFQAFVVIFVALWCQWGWLSFSEHASGPNSYQTLTLRIGSVGCVVGFVMAHSEWNGFARFLASCAITAAAQGMVWGVTQFWIGSRLYHLPLSINGIPYVYLRQGAGLMRTVGLVLVAAAGSLLVLVAFYVRERFRSGVAS